MSKKLRPENRAKASGPLSKVQKDFIAIHIARGATPRTVKDVMNKLSLMSRDTLRFEYLLPSFAPGHQQARTWADLAGTRQVSTADVRRVYDALRKSPGKLNETRRQQLRDFAVLDARNAALSTSTHLRYTSARKLHDLGFARRFGADRKMLSEIAEDELIPVYLESKS